MRIFPILPLLLVLMIACLAGWHASVRDLLGAAAWGAAVLLTRFPPLRREHRPRLNRWMAALMLAGLVWYSGTGTHPAPALGMAGFVALHLVILAAYAVVLFRILRRAGIEERMDEEFLRRDLWFLNLGLFCFVFIGLVEVMRAGLSYQAVLAGLVRGVQPLNLILLILLALRAAREAAGEKYVGWMTVAAAAAMLSLGGVRILEIQLALRQARNRLLEERGREAIEALDKAKSANRFLKMSRFQERETELRSRVYAADSRDDLALEHLTLYFRGRADRQTREPAPWKNLLLSYLKKGRLEDAFFTQLNRPGDLRALRQMHEELARHPEEEERLLLLFLRQGVPDRIEERYAWSGLPAFRNADAVELALERWRRNDPAAETRAACLLGVLLFRAESHESARRLFSAVLENAPTHHNAIVFLERIFSQEEDLRQLARLRRLPRRILKEDMMGGGLQRPRILYTALETNPGRYALRFDVRNTKDTPAHFRVYLDDLARPVFEATVSASDWKEIGVEQTFEKSERRTLLLVLDDMKEEEKEGQESGEPAILFRGLEIRSILE